MERGDVTPEIVRCLVGTLDPAWGALPIRRVERDGWDNATFRLGDALSVRLPTADGYVPQVEKEGRWLPVLARSLPLPIPEPVAQGRPACGFPRPWSVNRWLEGEDAGSTEVDDPVTFARDLAAFLVALRAIDPADGPAAGPHSFWRGGPLTVYDAETRAAIARLGSRIDGPATTCAWEAALEQPWRGRAVWLHGDVAPSNLLLRDGRLAAVLDFGCCAVGDPACDTVMAWTFFAPDAAGVFRAALGLDDATWARGRGWALWKALITLRDHAHDASALAATARRVGWRVGPAETVARIVEEAGAG